MEGFYTQHRIYLLCHRNLPVELRYSTTRNCKDTHDGSKGRKAMVLERSNQYFQSVEEDQTLKLPKQEIGKFRVIRREMAALHWPTTEYMQASYHPLLLAGSYT